VPFVRGRERSRKPEDILKEVRELKSDGVIEIMLLGQNVNSYGNKSNDDVTFPKLLEMIADLEPKMPRIRFMTSHPKDLSKELISTVKNCGNVCRHIHLPVQSGSDKILRAMNRGYTRGEYLSLLADLRREVPDITVTTDIIVGFPGETEEDFTDTLELVKQARFGGAFTFLYSKREGTKAAEMDGIVPGETASERFNRLVEAINPILLEINKSNEGKTVHVLVEKYADGMYTGRADNNMPVHFPGAENENIFGRIVPVEITEGKTFYLKGKQKN
jgi:tRNA-2-methylthio-N6-dimethylallyladenosine synthase